MKRIADKLIALLYGQRFVCEYLHWKTPIEYLKSFRDWYVNSATKLNSFDLVRAVGRWKVKFEYYRNLEQPLSPDDFSAFYPSHQFHPSIQMLIDRLELWSELINVVR